MPMRYPKRTENLIINTVYDLENEWAVGTEASKGCFLAILDRSRETIIHNTYYLIKTWNRTPSNGHASRETRDRESLV